MTACDLASSTTTRAFASMWSMKWITAFTYCLLSFSNTALCEAQIQYPYEYDFVSSDLGISGKLFLDAPASDNGSLADIGPDSYFRFALYGGYIPPVTIHPTAFYDSAEPGFTFAWDATKILTPLYIGFIQNSTFLSREFVNPNNPPPGGPDDEFDRVVWANAFVSSQENLYTGQTISSPTISLIASEGTGAVNGGGIVYNIPFYPGSTGEWLAVTPVPEPSQIVLTGFAFLGAGGLTWCFRRKSVRS